MLSLMKELLKDMLNFVEAISLIRLYRGVHRAPPSQNNEA